MSFAQNWVRKTSTSLDAPPHLKPRHATQRHPTSQQMDWYCPAMQVGSDLGTMAIYKVPHQVQCMLREYILLWLDYLSLYLYFVLTKMNDGK